jgi:hypothetical protein
MKKNFIEKHRDEVGRVNESIFSLIMDFVDEKTENDKLKDVEVRALVNCLLDNVFYSTMDQIYGKYAEINPNFARGFDKYIKEEASLEDLADSYKDGDYIPLVHLYLCMPRIMKDIKDKKCN